MSLLLVDDETGQTRNRPRFFSQIEKDTYGLMLEIDIQTSHETKPEVLERKVDESKQHAHGVVLVCFTEKSNHSKVSERWSIHSMTA